jgi:hypothetical protein
MRVPTLGAMLALVVLLTVFALELGALHRISEH